MTNVRPACDRHPNLQMVRRRIKTTAGVAQVYVCAVPGCGCLRDGDSDVDPQAVVPRLETKNPGNRQVAARAAILRAIEKSRPHP
jgi:hypothetical protein